MEDPIEGRGGQRDWGGDTGALGGYGSAGLFSRRRQMERTTGGSFLHLAEAPRGGATGGYVRMPGAGPEPVTRQVEYGRSMGPSGPGATAQFTKPNYYGPGPQEWAPSGRLARSLTAATRVIPWLKGDKEEPAPEEGAPPAPTPQLALPAGGRAMGTLEAGFVPFGALPPAVEGPRPVSTPPAGAIFATSRRRGRSTVGTEAEPRVMAQSSAYEYPYAQPPINSRKRKNRPAPNQLSLGFDQ